MALPPPSDPLFANQWHLNTAFGVNVIPAWDDYNGAGVRVAVFDQGIDRFHVDLDANYSVALSVNASSLAAGGTPVSSGDNHGTAVAGIIAAERNGVGVVGIAPNATLVAIYDSLSFNTVPVVAANAFNYAASHADVMNNSWGYGNLFLSSPNSAFIDDFNSPTLPGAGNAVANAGLNGRGGLGTVIVQSAGNTRAYGDDTNLHNFQNNRFTVTVAATLQDGSIAPYSTPGASILVAAPGSNVPGSIVTTDRSGSAGYVSGDYVTSFNGTSAAAPMVSGIVALMLDANPNLGDRDVQEILAYSARQTNSTAGYQFNGAHNWNGGGLYTSTDFGFGLVDATAAVRLAETWTKQQTWGNASSASVNVTVNQSIPENNANGISSSFAVAGLGLLDRIEINLHVTHTWIGDLVVTLRSPSDTLSTLVNRPGRGNSSQDNINFVLDSAQFWGENPNGTWTINVSDRAAQDVGTFNSYSAILYGAAATTDDLYVYTNEFATFGTGARATLADTNGGTDTLNAAAVTSGSIINLNPGSTSTIAGRSLTIAAGTIIENAFGGDGNDVIVGNSAANKLYGDRGNDLLIGGPAADQFAFHAPSEGVDTFVDFARAEGDQVVLDHNGFGLAGTGSLAAAGVSFVYGLIPRVFGPTILESQGNVFWDPDGTGASAATQFARDIGSGTMASVTGPHTGGWNVVAIGAFNNDNTSDILWQNASTGATSEWLMANGTLAGSPATPGAPGWNVIAAGNFNGDGISDLLWRHAASDMTAEWLMAPNGGVGALLGTPPVQGWNLLASADFNGDHITDLFWQHAASGATAEWLMAPTGGVASLLSTPPVQGWNLLASADFNGDGTTDLMWQHAASGATAEWLMAPTGGVGALLSTPPAQGWNMIATGDFNGDHIADLFWQHAASGATAEWLMAPTGGVGALLSTPPAQGWNVVATGDFNGDHITDLLWQHASSGATAEWLMAPTGGAGVLLSTPPAQGWNLVTAADFNGDGTTDPLWKHASAGVTSLWLTAPTGGVGAFASAPTAVGLDLIAAGDFSGDGATDLMWRNPSSGATTTWVFSHLAQQDFLVV